MKLQGHSVLLDSLASSPKIKKKLNYNSEIHWKKFGGWQGWGQVTMKRNINYFSSKKQMLKTLFLRTTNKDIQAQTRYPNRNQFA